MPQPLPENPYLPDSPRFHAYERCLGLKRSAENAPDNRSFSPQIRGRILGYMMREAPTSDGCDNVQKEIESRETDEALRALAPFYATQKGEGPYPRELLSPVPTILDDTQHAIMFLLEEAPNSNSAVKQLAPRRDNYRCVVTGAYDAATYQERRRTDPTFGAPTPPQFTQAAHIFPDSLNQDLAWPDGVPGKKVSFNLGYGTLAAS